MSTDNSGRTAVNMGSSDGVGSSSSRAPLIVNSSSPTTVLVKPKSVNSFAAQKTMVNGLFDLALLTANASQIKLVATQGSDAPHYYVLITLLVFSVLLQLATAVVLLLMGKENFDKLADGRHQKKRKIYWRLNVAATMLVFFITVINVFVAAFGLPSNQAIAVAET